VLIYALTIFIGAFLLFAVQPLFGKYILPWFGGSPEVWTTCMLFFQVLLLGGYAYAHFVSRLRPRLQAVIHIVLIMAAVAALPIVPTTGYKPQNLDTPILQILGLLVIFIGAPYFVLSSTGPLIQRWFSRANPGASPYWLYALSNAGSLIALVSYPFVVEPLLTRRAQAQVWSAGLVCFGAFCAYCAAKLWRSPSPFPPPEPEPDALRADAPSPSVSVQLLWFALPAGASVELLAVTNKVCMDLTVIPFLWVLPLSLYLLSFIICFHSEKMYVRGMFLGMFVLGIVGAILASTYERDLTAGQLIWIYSSMLISCCIVCHGELFRLRPHPDYLTRYYLMIGAGGAVGGLFVAVIAPLIFSTYRELYVGLLACCLFVLLADRTEALARGFRRWVWVTLVLAAGTAAMLVPEERGSQHRRAIHNSRNFFGVLTIWKIDPDLPRYHRYVLQHGTTFHGLQFVDPEMRLQPTSYYGHNSGVGLAIECLGRQQGRRIGIVGLGAGTLATYGKAGDYIRFYEINPEVKRLAEKHFTYLANCRANVDVIIGDARLSMENEPAQEFDILILDAFNSDAVPVHLLTKEAFEIYLAHLKPDGIIAMHVSSVHLELDSVVWKQADHLGLEGVCIEDDEDDEQGTFSSDWILLTRNEQFLDLEDVRQAASEVYVDYDRIGLWTDEYVNLLQVLR
jgi:hypothetical protein